MAAAAAATARTATPAPPCALLLLDVAATIAAAAPACETAKCGKGHCVERPGPFGLDMFRCDCDAGWSNMFKLMPTSPCNIPVCTFDSACFNISTALPPKGGIPLTDSCVAINCGLGGECVEEEGFSYHCACKPGFVNMLNLTELPCIKNCAFGKDCSALGLSPGSTPASAPAPAGILRGMHWLQFQALLQKCNEDK